MGATGLESSRHSNGKANDSISGGSKSGSKAAETTPATAPAVHTDPDLAAVVAAWSDLPAAVRAGIVAMVKAV